MSRVRLGDYANAAGEDAVDRLRKLAEPLRGARVLNVNSTAFGGGVAELLHTQVGMMRDLGIEADWQLLQGSDDFFAVTKAVHNGMQGMDVEWTEEMRRTYMDCVRKNSLELDTTYDYYFIHDPQPCALLAILEEAGTATRPGGRWIWRCHIDTSAPKHDVWDFFTPFVNRYDAAVFTMKDYAGDGIDGPQTAFIPPTIDPLSMKNVAFDPATSAAVLRQYGVDQERPIATQVSRFDPWKDPNGVVDAYRLARQEIPELQLLMVGSMASDDPEGAEFLEATRRHAGDDPDVHLLTNLDQVGSLEVNAFQRSSSVILQKSIREGFGLTVSEGMWKQKPVIGGNVGGIRLQIEDGSSGFLVDSVEQCAQRMVELLGDGDLSRGMGRAAAERVRENFLSLREVEDYCRLMASLA
jgi:trehalose synthase